MVAVEIEVKHKLSPKPFLVFRREGLHRLPLLIEFLYLFHSSSIRFHKVTKSSETTKEKDHLLLFDYCLRW
ncbi:hypothetical protein JCM10003_2755 [Bacteroides pyogenes JCM 10003]|nr:hypothetical protein JCM10003_2755 [Bacteroides pyogenes JCM 10003]